MNKLFRMDSPLMEGLTRIGDLLCLSVLWLVFSLPIFTIGASSAALYNTVYHCLRRNRTGVWQRFWNAFQENFKRSTLAWLIELGILAVLLVDISVFRTIKQSGGFMGNLYWAALFVGAVAITWTAYVAAYSARVNGTVKDVLRYGFLLLRLHPIKALGVMIPILVGMAMCLMVPTMLMLVPAAVCWVYSFTIEQVFRMHMQPEDLEKENALDALDKENN